MPDARPALAAPAEVRAALAAAHRDEWGRVFGALVRFTGDWTLAEDCTADAFERALTAWAVDGIPRVPGAWLTVTARRRALDLIKRSGVESDKLRLLTAGEDGSAPAADAALAVDDWQDDVLRLLFTCCHPALAMPARVALTLRTVGGLTTREIARAFLVSEATISQRILRGKQKIAHAGIPYRVPPPQLIEDRLAGVLAVIYLIFTEGYAATDGRVTRDDLAAEAIRLGRMLVALAPRDAEARGLLALMLLQNARRAARVDAAGEIVTLEHQDRRLWDRAAIAEGLALVAEQAGDPAAGSYALQAAVAAHHARAATAADTDWAAIVADYDRLLARHPSPIIEFNRAIALGFADGPDAGLVALDALAGPPGARRSSSVPGGPGRRAVPRRAPGCRGRRVPGGPCARPGRRGAPPVGSAHRRVRGGPVASPHGAIPPAGLWAGRGTGCAVQPRERAHLPGLDPHRARADRGGRGDRGLRPSDSARAPARPPLWCSVCSAFWRPSRRGSAGPVPRRRFASAARFPGPSVGIILTGGVVLSVVLLGIGFLV